MGDWMPWVIGAGMGGLITFFYLQTVSSNPALAAGSSATKTG